MDLDKKFVTYNGVKIDLKEKLKKLIKKSLYHFGRLRMKMIRIFINITKKYLKFYNDAIFNVYGDGSMLINLKKKKNNNIVFHGWVNKTKFIKNQILY